MHYFGNGFYKWYTRSEFALQLCSMFAKGADVNVALSEMFWHKPFTSRVHANVFEHLLRMTDDALQHYLSHDDTEGEIVPYSGPQCHADRDNRELMNNDPLMHYNNRLIPNLSAIGSCPKFQTTPPPPQPLNVARDCSWCENKPINKYNSDMSNLRSKFEWFAKQHAIDFDYKEIMSYCNRTGKKAIKLKSILTEVTCKYWNSKYTTDEEIIQEVFSKMGLCKPHDLENCLARRCTKHNKWLPDFNFGD